MAGQGTSVTAADYNAIQSIAAQVLGAPTDPSPQYGYNQTVLSSQVVGGIPSTPVDKVTVQQWSNLQRDLVYARIHQNGNLNESSQLPVPTTSNIITESFRSAYATYAQTVYNNASVSSASQMTIVNVGTAQRINVWNGDISSTVTLDFANIQTARAFWNTGGNVTVACSLTGSFGALSATKDNTWAGMFGAMGTITINRNTTTISGSSTGGYTCTPTNKGYFDLTTSNTLLFTCTPPSGAYAANSFKIFGNVDASGRYLTILIQYNDDSTTSAGSSAQWGGDEYVDGILTQYIGCRRPSGSYVSLSPPGIGFTGDLTNVASAPGLYGLSSTSYNVNEGDSFTVSLQTLNVNQGATVYYSVSGMPNTPNGVARWSASASYFTVGANGLASLTFQITNDLYSDGVSTMVISLTNGLASITLNVNDTSKTPKDATFLSTAQQFQVPLGIYKIKISMVGGGGGGGSYSGGGGGGGQVSVTTVDVSPQQQISFSPGAGGGGGGGGQTTYFGTFTALAGYAGGNGSYNGTSKNYVGGTGGQSGAGNAGGSGSSTGVSSNIKFAGGGGGGSGGTGNNATTGSPPAPGTSGQGTIVSSTYTQYPVQTGAPNYSYYLGGGGEGGSSFDNPSSGASYGGGPGGGAGQTGSNGTDGTGGGGGGGGVSVAGGTFTGVYVDSTVTGLAGGSGGRGGIFIQWPA